MVRAVCDSCEGVLAREVDAMMSTVDLNVTPISSLNTMMNLMLSTGISWGKLMSLSVFMYRLVLKSIVLGKDMVGKQMLQRFEDYLNSLFITEWVKFNGEWVSICNKE